MEALGTIDHALLAPSDGPPVDVLNPSGKGPWILICEHASRRLPAALGTLGVNPAGLDSHAAWDPGALDLAERLSDALDASLVAARFSRLAFDCNRPLEAADAVADRTERIDIPGNRHLTPAARQARFAAIYRPFHEVVGGLIDARRASGGRPALVTVHSFVPAWFGRPRSVGIGVLHDADRRLADAVLDRLEASAPLEVARNAPYGPEDGVTHTLRHQALPRGLLNVMLEVRSDLIADAAGVGRIADLLVPALTGALPAMAEG